MHEELNFKLNSAINFRNKVSHGLIIISLISMKEKSKEISKLTDYFNQMKEIKNES